MESPTNMVKNPATNQPQVVEAGPPKVRPVLNNVVIPVSTDMIEKENAKFDRTLPPRPMNARLENYQEMELDFANEKPNKGIKERTRQFKLLKTKFRLKENRESKKIL